MRQYRAPMSAPNRPRRCASRSSCTRSLSSSVLSQSNRKTMSSSLDDPAGNPCIFFDLVNRAQPVIAVGDDYLAVSFVPDQQDRGQRDAFLDFPAILGDPQIADAESRQLRSAKDVFRPEARRLRASHRGNQPGALPAGVNQLQIGLGGVEVV